MDNSEKCWRFYPEKKIRKTLLGIYEVKSLTSRAIWVFQQVKLMRSSENSDFQFNTTPQKIKPFKYAKRERIFF
jgi:hypothetical protein